MTNLKTVIMKVLKKLIFSIFLASLLLFVLFQKTKSQIVGIDKTSKKELIKNLQNQVDQQKTQLDTIKTTLGTLESKITEQEESMKKIDAEQEFKKQLEESKQKLKNAWIAYLSLEPEITTDQELTEKFNQAKEATNMHEQEFISKLESKKEAIKEIEYKIEEQSTLEKPTKQEKIQKNDPINPEVQSEYHQENLQTIQAPTKEKSVLIKEKLEIKEPKEQINIIPENSNFQQLETNTQVQQNTESIKQEIQETESVEPIKQTSEINPTLEKSESNLENAGISE